MSKAFRLPVDDTRHFHAGQTIFLEGQQRAFKILRKGRNKKDGPWLRVKEVEHPFSDDPVLKHASGRIVDNVQDWSTNV